MFHRKVNYGPRIVGLVLLLTVITVSSAATAANVVVESGADHDSFLITANDLKPPECAGLNLTAIVTGSGTFQGTAANELILGSANADNIRGRGGDDCILGGRRGDTLRGNQGNDVILGGRGRDTINGGNGTNDICHGGSGSDSFNGCETIFDP